jgi:hypothetical protein
MDAAADVVAALADVEAAGVLETAPLTTATARLA